MLIQRQVYLWYMYRRKVLRFQARAAHARSIQEESLLRNLRRHAESDFGRTHGFSQIHSAADFRRQVPITDYEYVRPAVERVRHGETQALFGRGTQVVMYAMTSGTTGKPKYVPVTTESFHDYRAGWNLWGLAAYHDHPDLLAKKTLSLCSDWRQELAPDGTPCGNISGLAAETRPWTARQMFFLPAETIRIHDFTSKYYTTLRFALAARDLGMIITANPLTLLELVRIAESHATSLIRDIHDGTLSPSVEVPSPIRARLAPWIQRRDPDRAHELERIISEQGGVRPRSLWPQLTLLSVWSAGSVGTFIPKVRELFGGVPVRDHGLSASEGRMTIPFDDNSRTGTLDFQSHYFEFIPEEEHGGEHPIVLGAHELEVGRRYFILLTVPAAGLYRYDIHDVVACTGYQGETPLLEFLNKGAHFSSITGEKLTEYQVVRAVEAACVRLTLPITTFTLAPRIEETRCSYRLLLECGAHTEQGEDLARHVDAELAELNWEYRQKRESARLGPVTIESLPVGTWTEYRRARTSARSNFEQFKHPCLSADPDFAPALLTSTSSSATPQCVTSES